MITPKKLILAGIGFMSFAAKKIDQTISQALSEGARVKKEGEEAFMEAKEDFKKVKTEAREFLLRKCKKVINNLDLVTKEDIDNLSQRIKNIEARLSDEIKKN